MMPLEYILNDPEACKILNEKMDLILQAPEDFDDRQQGCPELSIAGQVFAYGHDGSCYLLLEDDTVAYVGAEGHSGRLAQTMADFFVLVINCICWQDFTLCPGGDRNWFEDRKVLSAFIENHQEKQDRRIRDELAQRIDLPVYTELEPVLSRFYEITEREPRFTAFWNKEEKRISEGLLSDVDFDLCEKPVSSGKAESSLNMQDKEALRLKYHLE